jgi:hypothetical protein
MSVSSLVVAAFGLASQKYPDVHDSWIKASFRIGGLLPSSRLGLSIQGAGSLDMVLRCMEDELATGSHGDARGEGHFQNLLSGLWIGMIHES